MTTPLQSPQLEQEIRSRIERLYLRTLRVLELTMPAGKRERIADWYIKTLRAEDDDGEEAARQIVELLVDPAELATTHFWGTALGRAVAWHIGYVEDAVPNAVVAAVLGVSRQAVHDAFRRGALAPAGAEGVALVNVGRGGLRDYLRAQARGRA